MVTPPLKELDDHTCDPVVHHPIASESVPGTDPVDAVSAPAVSGSTINYYVRLQYFEYAEEATSPS